jgi:hypothetical protein
VSSLEQEDPDDLRLSTFSRPTLSAPRNRSATRPAFRSSLSEDEAVGLVEKIRIAKGKEEK